MEGDTYEWEFSWFWATVIIGPVLLLLIGMIIRACVNDFARYELEERQKETKRIQKEITRPKNVYPLTPVKITSDYEKRMQDAERVLNKAVKEARRDKEKFIVAPEARLKAKGFSGDLVAIPINESEVATIPFEKPKAPIKKTRLADEPLEHKESFFDKLFGRIPREDN